jgi:hypothetical protein
MDDHRSADALTDVALNRDLEAALAVEPSPEFAARLRTRIQRERDAAPSPWRWQMAAAVACVAITALVIGTSKLDRVRVARDDRPARRQLPVAPRELEPGPRAVAKATMAGEAFGPAPTTRSRTAVRRSRRSAAVGEPQLLIAADEARALRQLFSSVQKGLVDLSSLPEVAPAFAALQPLDDISFPPITFEPIMPEAVGEGERQ